MYFTPQTKEDVAKTSSKASVTNTAPDTETRTPAGEVTAEEETQSFTKASTKATDSNSSADHAEAAATTRSKRAESKVTSDLQEGVVVQMVLVLQSTGDSGQG